MRRILIFFDFSKFFIIKRNGNEPQGSRKKSVPFYFILLL